MEVIEHLTAPVAFITTIFAIGVVFLILAWVMLSKCKKGNNDPDACVKLVTRSRLFFIIAVLFFIVAVLFSVLPKIFPIEVVKVNEKEYIQVVLNKNINIKEVGNDYVIVEILKAEREEIEKTVKLNRLMEK